MRFPLTFLFATSLATGAVAQPAAPTPPVAGGRPTMGADTGPATQPPTTAGPQTQNRGTDGSVAGKTEPGATAISPQGMMATSTAGSQQPNMPIGGAPPASDGVAPRN